MIEKEERLAQLPIFDPEDEVVVEEIEHAPPSNARSVARSLALQVLYEVDLARHAADEVMARQLEEVQPPRETARYVRKIVHGVLEYYPEIDQLIKRFAPEFPLDQIALVDRNILRIAIFEFGVSVRVPVSVAINEAVELAKRFGAEGSAAFVNGVLGAVADDPQILAELAHPSDEEEDE